MILTRGLCFLFVALSYLFASSNISIIVNIMSFSWGTVSGCFIGAYIWGIFSKKVTKVGAWAGMLAGFASVLLPTVIISLTDCFATAASLAPQMGVIAMAVSFVTVPLVSLFTKKPSDEHIAFIFHTEKE